MTLTAIGAFLLLQIEPLLLDQIYKALLIAVILGGLFLVFNRSRDEAKRTRQYLITNLIDVGASATVTLGLAPFIFDILHSRGWNVNYQMVICTGFLTMAFGWQIRPILLSIAKYKGLQTDLLKTIEELEEENKKLNHSKAPDKQDGNE